MHSETIQSGFTQSVADGSEEHAAFWSKIAREYDRVVDLQIGPETRAMVRNRVLAEQRLGRLAEFGCGTGFYTDALASKADSVVVTDLAPGMLAVARERIRAANVAFQVENIERTSFADGALDTAFVSLVLHFAEPRRALAEMHRIVRPGGTLIVANLDPGALRGLDRVRCWIRILFHGIAGYRTKPPQRFGENLLSEDALRRLLTETGFEVSSVETVQNRDRSSYVPIEYVRAVRL